MAEEDDDRIFKIRPIWVALIIGIVPGVALVGLILLAYSMNL